MAANDSRLRQFARSTCHTSILTTVDRERVDATWRFRCLKSRFPRRHLRVCLYLAGHALENEDAIIASALGIPERLIQVRTLLHNGDGVPRVLLDSIAVAHAIPSDRLLPFEGRPLRNLYTEGFCGGAVIPLGAAGTPRQDVHVPLAHQSALAGLLLAAAAVKHALGLNPSGTQVTRIDVMRPLGSHLTQRAAKDRRGICICQDADYRDIYKRKYAKC